MLDHHSAINDALSHRKMPKKHRGLALMKHGLFWSLVKPVMSVLIMRLRMLISLNGTAK
jgi:hypothetical protein